MASSNTAGNKRATLSHRPSEATISELTQDENTPLLSNNSSSLSNVEETDPTALYVKAINEHLPWHKRPSVLWLLPIFTLAWISTGMLTSSLGQFQASLLCREYLNRHTSNTTLLASEGVMSFLAHASNAAGSDGIMVALRPAAECQVPEIQAFTAKILAFIEVIGGVASMFSIGYYSSLSDKHGRRIVMLLSFCNTLLHLGSLVVMGMYWDQVGLPLMIVSGLVQGLLGGTSLGLTMTLAYAADCTDPAKRSLVFSWLHAGLFLGLAVGPFLGGTIVRATNTILTVVFIDITVTVVCLLLTLVFIPESLPAKQAAQVQRLYESFAKKSGAMTAQSQERVAWHSHAMRALSFFRPNGRNTNLILLAAISFLQMLAFRGTLSIIILYTNRMFQWTEYEDGIMFSLSSLVRLFTMLVLLPVLVHFHRRSYRKKQSKVQAKATSDARRDGKLPNSSSCDTIVSGSGHQQDPIINSVDMTNQIPFNPNDPNVTSSVQHLGEAAFDFTADQIEASTTMQDRRHRQTSVDSIASLASARTAVPNSSQFDNGINKTSRSQTAAGEGPRTKDQTFSDMKFDTWMVRLGFIINSVTYIGYGLAREGWVFYLAAALHAMCIISSPSLKSLLTNLVEPSQFGAVLGAIQVVDSIAAIFSPIVISWVYALTVKSMPEFVWYSCAAWAAIAVVLSFMIRQKQFRNKMDA